MDFHKYCIFFLIFTTCFIIEAARLPQEGMLEGYESKVNQFPYQVSIFAENWFICGGGIIDDQYILTAAHCVINEKNEFRGIPLKIAAGINDMKNWETDAIVLDVLKIYVPEGFDRIVGNTGKDIAVLKLNQSLNIGKNPNLKKLKLPENPTETYTNKKATIAGFGMDWMNIIFDPKTKKLKEEGGWKETTLKYLNADVLENNECGLHYKIQNNRKFYMCAKVKQKSIDKPSGVCSGDSGGPLVYSGETVIGIVSKSPFGCVEYTKPGLYTRVSSFRKFINNAKNDNVTQFMRIYEF